MREILREGCFLCIKETVLPPTRPPTHLLYHLHNTRKEAFVDIAGGGLEGDDCVVIFEEEDGDLKGWVGGWVGGWMNARSSLSTE